MAKDDTARFRVLLAEDDLVSRSFLVDCLQACGAEVGACADGSSALARARTEHWDLLLLDHHLPGMGGDAVLAALRADPAARSRASPALATSAAGDEARPSLDAAGFAGVLAKPITTAALRAALRAHGCRPPGPLDDDDALRACGSPEAVARLRRLFAEQELPRIRRELQDAAGDPAQLRPMLHRLAASCGFCGTPQLARACAATQAALDGRDADALVAAIARLREALAATGAALRTRLDPPD